MSERGITRTEIHGQLSKSVHGKLIEYSPVIITAAKQDPEFLAHIIAFDCTNGQIKDSKVALPILSIASSDYPSEFIDNSLAHLALLSPRDLLKAIEFSITLKLPSTRQKKFEAMIRRYLHNKQEQSNKWYHWVARHRRAVKRLYSLSHCGAPTWVKDVLFRNDYTAAPMLRDIANLHKMTPSRAAATIGKWHLSPLIISGAMAGSKEHQKDSSVVQATMEQMSSTELVTRAKSLEKRGVGKDASLKSTFRSRIAKAVNSNKATLKTSVAAEEMEDESLKTMLHELQERQIQAQKDSGKGIEGNWLVICDRSSSQQHSIELGVHVSAAISKFVTGQVHLTLCNKDVIGLDCTGKSLEQLKQATRHTTASGSTSYGIGLEWAMSKNLKLDGIVIVGDGGENEAPIFAPLLNEYSAKLGKKPPVYFYQTFCPPEYALHPGGSPLRFGQFMKQHSIAFTQYDLTKGDVDYYSIPNLVAQMNANRFGVIEKIMACPLLTLEEILPLEYVK